MEVIEFSKIGISDKKLVGGKISSLGEMINNLSFLEIKVPNGFAITTIGYKNFITFNNLKIDIALSKINYNELASLQFWGRYIRHIINKSKFPPDLEKLIIQKYNELNLFDNDKSYAIRSSSTAEDLQDASFAGQQETFLNVRGVENILKYIKLCFASLYTDRAISYRHSINYKEPLDICVGVQQMVESVCSGVAFSLDPDTGFEKTIVINGSWGLGELIVQGGVKPDEFIVFSSTMKIIDKKMGDKTSKMIYCNNNLQNIIKVDVCSKQKNTFCLNDENILKLAKYVKTIENYYSSIYNKYTPVDVEWGMENNELYILQARPETVHSNKKSLNYVSQYEIKTSLSPIIQGIAVGDKISTGKVRIITKFTDFFEKGDILVTDMTDPDWEPLMVKANGIITNKGGRTCHSAIIAREMGINAVVGTNNATEILQNEQEITISCAEGEVGYIYNGIIDYIEYKYDLSSIPKIKTKLMFNIASPNDVFKYASYPVKGVGLVREEFIINNYIKVHPLALINYDKNSEEIKKQIDELIIGYTSPTDFFINKLAYGLARIAATFYPQDVIVRFSDFKSNEYRNLLGGYLYEPHEENPLIGWRGCSRYYSELFKPAFGLECLAIKKLREEMGLSNVILMLPFCRDIDECIQVQEVMKEYGLERGVNGLQLYIMAEIPSNIILAKEFAKIIDGFSIGSNDLTQLILGLDRDSNLVAHIYDERNPAVTKMISKLIKICKKNNVKVGICGNAPSTFPDFAKFLVTEGIDSISITPDAIFKTCLAIHDIEQNI